MSHRRNQLSYRLKLLREEKGISQYKLAEHLNLSRGLLSNYEQGSREPDYDTLILLADYYEVSTDYLLGITNVKKRWLDSRKQSKYDKIMQDIGNLSDQSIVELKQYLELLKMRDAINQKGETKSS